MKPVVSNRLALDMNGMLVLFSVSTLSSPDLILTICPSFNMFPIPENNQSKLYCGKRSMIF